MDHQGAPALEPRGIGGWLPLEKVYSYEPTPAALTPEEAKYIIGTQGNVWPEFIHSPEKVEYMSFPRAAALAEVAWTAAALKNWDGFKERLEKQYLRYDALEINYSKSAYNVIFDVVGDAGAQQALGTLKTGSHDPQIYYTVDGTEPGLETLKYTVPFHIRNPGVIKAAAFRNGKQRSKLSVRAINEKDLNGRKD